MWKIISWAFPWINIGKHWPRPWRRMQQALSERRYLIQTTRHHIVEAVAPDRTSVLIYLKLFMVFFSPVRHIPPNFLSICEVSRSKRSQESGYKELRVRWSGKSFRINVRTFIFSDYVAIYASSYCSPSVLLPKLHIKIPFFHLLPNPLLP